MTMNIDDREWIGIYDTIGLFFKETSNSTLLEREEEIELACSIVDGRRDSHRISQGRSKSDPSA